LWRKNVAALLIHAFGEGTTQHADFEGILYYNVYADINSGGGGLDVFGNGAYQYDANEDFREGLQEASVQLTAIREEVIKYFPDTQSTVSNPSNEVPPKCNNRKVFVVHGHDEALRLKVASALTVLEFKPIILRDQPNKGRTIIEKFEDNSDAGFAVVLLTADDIGYDKKKPEEACDRARQNVVLEMGFFIGKLGRDRVMVICDPSVEKPGDVSGVVYTDSTNDGNWRFELVRELKAAGYSVDGDKLF